MTQEALKLALDALETELSIDWTNNDEFNASAEKMYEAITAIKEALAKEKALQALHSENERLGLYKDAYAQPEQEPVCPDCKAKVLYECVACSSNNYPPKTEQEPVAVVDVHEFYDNCANFSLLQKLSKGKHTLYTTPPQRKEPPDWFHAVENILNEYGLQAIDFVADFKAAMKDAEHSQRTEQNFCSRCGKRLGGINSIHTCTPPMEKNT